MVVHYEEALYQVYAPLPLSVSIQYRRVTDRQTDRQTRDDNNIRAMQSVARVKALQKQPEGKSAICWHRQQFTGIFKKNSYICRDGRVHQLK